jgi:hypothetical protein
MFSVRRDISYCCVRPCEPARAMETDGGVYVGMFGSASMRKVVLRNTKRRGPTRLGDCQLRVTGTGREQ